MFISRNYLRVKQRNFKFNPIYMEVLSGHFSHCHLQSNFKFTYEPPFELLKPRIMALTLGIEKQFSQTSERVKSVDLHPTEPWILVGLYSGTVCVWNYQSQIIEKSFKVTESPVRSAKFIARKHWIVTGADDKFIRVYNYETMELIKEFEAHQDFIRCVCVHLTLPYVLSASDDKFIKMWDWEKDWECAKTFEGHAHYVMQVVFNPKDTNTFASASLDATIKIWNLDSPAPIATLDGHSKGVNFLEYFRGGGEPYLVSGSDDFSIKVWDYETKTCVKTLEGHTNNVTAVSTHSELPIIISGSEDGTIRIWDAHTFGLYHKLDYGLGRVWAVGCRNGSDQVAFGCDNGITMDKVSISSHY